jgi:hypothetical protein
LITDAVSAEAGPFGSWLRYDKKRKKEESGYFPPGKAFVFRHLLQVMDGLGETRYLDVIGFACQGFGVGDRQTGLGRDRTKSF